MSLTPVDGVLSIINKALSDDLDGGTELLRIATFEALCDEAERLAPDIEARARARAIEKSADLRRALVRSYIDKRLAGDDSDLGDLLTHAAHLTVIEAHAHGSVAKNFDPKEARDKKGRWTGAIAAFTGGSKEADIQRPGYANLRATGTALNSLGLPYTSTAGTAAQLVGDLGPQAERVLGPGLRRTAYRYRGTERRRDPQLAAQLKAVRHDPKAAPGASSGDWLLNNSSNSAALDTARTKRGDLHTSLLARSGGSENARQFREMHDSPDLAQAYVRADLATNYLLSKLPDLRLSEISLASGRVPPSQGVAIDADGDLVTDAVGFNGDHYLPFDLKNLKALHGGQYARTRGIGGPTTEDIYTGLVTGSRAMTVVSHSGVFTVEFDPSLRGSRRYSDKARAMVGRYGQLLEAVDDPKSEIYPQDIPQLEKTKLHAQAAEFAEYDPDATKIKYNELLTNARNKALLVSPDDVEAAGHKAVAEASKRPGATKQSVARAREDAERDAAHSGREASVRRLRLNGEGYAAALSALKQEFPALIRDVSYEPLDVYTESRQQGTRPTVHSGDRAHVTPGNSLPTNAGFGSAAGAAKDRYRRLSPSAARREEAPERTTIGGATAPKAVSGGANEGVIAGFPKPDKTALPLSEAVSALDFVALFNDDGIRIGRGLRGAAHPRYNDPLAIDKYPNIESASTLPPDDFVVWMLAKHPNDLSGTLLASSTPQSAAEHFISGLREWERSPASMESLAPSVSKDEFSESINRLEAAVQLRNPFAKGAPSVTTVPDPVDPKPQAFTGIVDLGASPKNFDAWLTHAKVTQLKKVAELAEDMSTAELASSVRTAATQFGKIVSYGHSDVDRKPVGLDVAITHAEAKKVAADPERSERYTELRNLQLAWSFKHARSAATAYARLSGGEVEVPKDPLAKAFPAERFAKLFPTDGPVAKLFASL